LLLALNNPRTNAVTAVAAVGSVHVREIIERLKQAIDEYTDGDAVKSAADRSESGKKPKLSQETIKATADAAEPRSKPANPAAAADDDLGIPPFLRRGATTTDATSIDEEAAAIAAEASRNKSWLN
jgi:hypothetical protein